MDTEANTDIFYGDIKKIIDEDSGAKVIRVINSSLCFAAAYIIANYVFQFAMAGAAILRGFRMTLKYDTVLLPPGGSGWAPSTVLFIYSAGPVMSLILGIAAWKIFIHFRENTRLINLFFFWLFLHGTCLFLIQWVIAAIGVGNYYSPFYTGLAVAAVWMGLPPVLFYGMLLPCFIAIIVIGISIADSFLGFSFSRRYVQNFKGRKIYFLQIAFLPLLISSLIIFPLSLPNFIFPAIHLCAVLAVLIVAFIRLDYLADFTVLRYHTLQFLSWGMLVVLLSLIVITLTIFRQGIAV